MEAKVEKLAKNNIKLTITVPAKDMVKYFDKAFEAMAPAVKIQGFRPGKAPRNLIESTIGISRILSEALDQAVNESYAKSLAENRLSPISNPNIAISKYPTYGQTVEEVKDDLVYTVEFTNFPDVVIGDYSKERIELPKKEAVSQEDVDKILKNLQGQKANFTPIEREAKKGDLAELNFEGFLKGVKIDQMCSKNHPVVLGENTLIPGFEDEVVGLKKGDKKDFKIKFPKDYHSKDYAGKEAEFKIELVDLKEVVMPEVNDEFAKDFGQDSKEILLKEIEANIQSELDKKYESDVEGRVLDKLLPLVKVEIPEIMTNHEVDRLIHDYEHQLQHMGLDFKSYLESIKKTEEDLRKDMKAAAEKNIKIGLLLGKVIGELNLDPNDQASGKKAVDHMVEVLTKK